MFENDDWWELEWDCFIDEVPRVGLVDCRVDGLVDSRLIFVLDYGAGMEGFLVRYLESILQI